MRANDDRSATSEAFVFGSKPLGDRARHFRRIAQARFLAPLYEWMLTIFLRQLYWLRQFGGFKDSHHDFEYVTALGPIARMGTPFPPNRGLTVLRILMVSVITSTLSMSIHPGSCSYSRVKYPS